MPPLIRRTTNYEPRIEMTPLLDVIFFLLTFFIYALVLSIRAEIVPVRLPTVASGQDVAPGDIVALTVDRAGALFLNGKPAPIDTLETALRDLKTATPEARFFLAIDDTPGDIDRAPLFVRIIDTLRRAGIDDFALVGRPAE